MDELELIDRMTYIATCKLNGIMDAAEARTQLIGLADFAGIDPVELAYYADGNLTAELLSAIDLTF